MSNPLSYTKKSSLVSTDNYMIVDHSYKNKKVTINESHNKYIDIGGKPPITPIENDPGVHIKHTYNKYNTHLTGVLHT